MPLNVLLAIVPDPIHTHLALFFDRQIDAIQQAAQDNGYLFDRAIMPWDYQEHPEPSDFHLRLLERQYQAANEKGPGLMIFRPAPRNEDEQQNAQDHAGSKDNTGAKSKSWLVFLVVAETPTAGVNPDQFQTALGIISCLPSSEHQTFPILGPTFSGSLDSVKRLLHDLPVGQRFDKFTMFSGTVSSYASGTNFSKLADRITFASFTENAELQELLFLRFLADRRYDPHQIAILAEDETAYGESATLPRLHPLRTRNSR